MMTEKQAIEIAVFMVHQDHPPDLMKLFSYLDLLLECNLLVFIRDPREHQRCACQADLIIPAR